MKVYLVVSEVDYEGHFLDSDEKVFLSKDKAEVYRQVKQDEDGPYYDWQVIEYEVEE